MREKIVRVPELKTERSPEAEKAAPLNEKEGAFSGMAAPGQSESPTQFRTQPTEPLREIPNEKQETRQANLQESKCEKDGGREEPAEKSAEIKGEKTEKKTKKKSLGARCKERLIAWKNAFLTALNERSAEVKHAKLKRILFFVAVGLLLVGFAAFYFAVGKKIALFIKDADAFREWLEGFGKSAIFVFICLRVVQIVFKLIPGEALEIAAGCIFGTWEGLLWCMVGSLIGSLIIVLLGKRYGMKIVGLFVSPEKMQSLAFLKDRKRLNFTFFLLYFIPGTPKDMFTWLVCLTDENIFVFLLLTNLARIPSVIASTWCGQELINQNYWVSAAIFGGTVVLAVIGGLIYRFALKKKKAVAETDPEAAEEN